MRYKSTIVSGILYAGLVALSCTPPRQCETAIFPFNGQTNVDLNTVVSFYVNNLEAGTPAFSTPPTLKNLSTGELVSGSFEIDVDNQKVVFKPDSPLEEGVDYEASGVRLSNSRHHSLNMFSSSTERGVATVQFTTASNPTLLGYSSVGYYYDQSDAPELLILCSEPLHPDDAASFEFEVFDEETEEYELDFEFLGFDPNNPSIIRYQINGDLPSYGLIVSGEGLRAVDDDSIGEPFSSNITEAGGHPLLTGSSFCSLYDY